MASHAITDWATVEKYQLGYVASPLKGDERFQGRLAIPYLTPTGTAAMKFRRLEGEGGRKYDQHHGQKPRLFNTWVCATADHTIGICEGEIDAIVATEKLGIPTLGVAGSDGWNEKTSEIWTPIFKDYRLVLVFTDGDDAGRKLGDAVGQSLGHRARIIACDPGEDVASMVVAGKASQLCQLARE